MSEGCGRCEREWIRFQRKKMRHKFGRAHWMALTITTMKQDQWKMRITKKNSISKLHTLFFVSIYCCILITMHEWNITTIVGSGPWLHRWWWRQRRWRRWCTGWRSCSHYTMIIISVHYYNTALAFFQCELSKSIEKNFECSTILFCRCRHCCCHCHSPFHFHLEYCCWVLQLPMCVGFFCSWKSDVF